MNCAIHQQTPVVAYCRTCGKPMCEVCKRDVRGIVYCEDCLASHVQGTPAAPGVVNPNAPHPGVALVLGFIPGVGAMYCGEFMRAFIHVAVFAVLGAVASEVYDWLSVLVIFWYFYMVFDSYQVAKAKQEGRPVPEIFGFAAFSRSGITGAPSPAVAATPSSAGLDSTGASPPSPAAPPLIDASRSRNLPIGPVVLIALGILFLLHTMGVWHFFRMARLWPLILVGIGGWLIYQRTQRVACRCVACTAISMMGPAILVTVGVMGLLSEFTRFGWRDSWPLILIVIGVLKFLQITGSRAGHIGPGGTPPATPPASPEQGEVTNG